jgi:hypothetical protein
MEVQIRNTFYKAFSDKINDTVNSDTPDYDWIILLYKEIKERIIQYVKKDSKVYETIDDAFDVVLFEQMIRNDVFDQKSMLSLINITYYWIYNLQAPIRDKETDESKKRVLNSEPNSRVSTFIIEVNRCIDNIDADLKNIINNK